MPSQGNLLTIPPGPPAPLFGAGLEDSVDVTRITVTRAGYVTDLGGWVSGDAAGVDPDQPITVLLYGDDGTTLRPGALLAKSVATTISGALVGTFCGKLPVDGAPLLIQPGTYWVGVDIGPSLGTGELIIHGSADPGRGHRITGYPYGSPPNPWPLTGGTTFTNTGAEGLVYTQVATAASGAICGTFLCGVKLAGELSVPFNQPQLMLKGRLFRALVANDFKQVVMGKPKLTLVGKTAQVSISVSALMGEGRLILAGKPFAINVPNVVSARAPDLILNGKAFSLNVEVYLVLDSGSLLLRGGKTSGKIPGLLPTVIAPVILVPTVDYAPVVLDPTEVGQIILSPTEVAVG